MTVVYKKKRRTQLEARLAEFQFLAICPLSTSPKARHGSNLVPLSVFCSIGLPRYPANYICSLSSSADY